ncbi:MAG: Gfo/Idh/MocA family oxidoreductase [Balneolales bacterium]
MTDLNHTWGTDRRDFIKKMAVTATGLTVGYMSSGNFAYAAGTDKIRIGIIGCGRRGTGAVRDCIRSSENVELVAMGDLFADQLQVSKERLREIIGPAFKVTDENSFVGFDAYQKVLDTDIDIVLLTTPPGFRPLHLRAAVEKGKHVFMEKPVAVDTAGVKSVLQSGEMAKSKGLSLVAGTQYRRKSNFIDSISLIHDGEIGIPLMGMTRYLTGSLWVVEKTPVMTDMEWQLRNWYYFTWLSGDFIVEQFVHNLDTANWIFNGPPLKCWGMGGRQVRVEPKYGHIYDNFNIHYEYPNGVEVIGSCRQMEGANRNVGSQIIGSNGKAIIETDRSELLNLNGESIQQFLAFEENPYEKTHEDLIKSIREGTPLNETKKVAEATMTAVMGRESAYTGQEITWDQIMNAELDLVPESVEFGPATIPPVAVPNVTRLNRTI